MKSPVTLLISVLTDVKRLSLHTKGLDRDIHTIYGRFEHEGNGFLTVALPALGSSFLDGLETGKFTCPRNFKTIPRGTIPRLFSGMFCEVFDKNTGLILDKPCEECIQNIHLITRLFKKLLPSNDKNQILITKAMEQYELDERHVRDSRKTREPQYMRQLVRVANICLGQFKYDRSTMIGQHGPGSVCEGLSPNDKWRYLPSALCNSSEPGLQVYHEFFGAYGVVDEPFADARSVECKVISVPKTNSSVRLITVEPFLNQFFQGGLNKILRSNIKDSRILSNCLTLNNQENNQKLSLSGSMTRNTSTIDLKSASDLLDNELVKLIFSTLPDLSQDLQASRTRVANFNGKKFLHEKYAGMGNATTFPVQSICFAIISIAAICTHMGREPTYGLVRRIAADNIQVYGDDIIVSTEYYRCVVDWLSHFGLKPNLTKSFSNGYFRESCGVDAYNGVDITPIYVRHYPTKLCAKDASIIQSLVSLSNSLWMKGLYNASALVKKRVEAVLGMLPLVSNESQMLGWSTRQNVRSYTKWDRNLHSFTNYAYIIKPKKLDDVLSGVPALMKFFHNCREAVDDEVITSEDHLLMSSKRYHIRLEKRRCTVH